MNLNQITIPVIDLERSIAFYCTLGLKIIVRSDQDLYARFELPSGTSTLSIHEDKSFRPGSIVVYFEVPDVQEKYQKLINSGIVFSSEPTTESWRWTEARLEDPSGNHLCIYHAGDNRLYPPWRV